MKYEAAIRSVLSEFKIGRNYAGYDYIIDGINLMEEDESSIAHITKTIYIDIANKHKTTNICVERNIRTTIENIWKNKNCNIELLIRIFGSDYLIYRPSNTKFFELLYHYVAACSREYAKKDCPHEGCEYCILKCRQRNQ